MIAEISTLHSRI